MEYIRFNPYLFDGSAVTDITDSAGMSAEMKTYYKTRLLDHAKPNLVHDQVCKKVNIPAGNGKSIEFRRSTRLDKNLTAIEEGKTPVGKNMSIESFTANVRQYGDYIQSSDVLQTAAVDPIIEERSKLLGDQAGRTLDTVSREVLNSGTNVIYAPKLENGTETEVTGRNELGEGCRLTLDLIFRAAAQLKAENAPRFDGGDYVAIIHPYSAYDLMMEAKETGTWMDVSKYAGSTQVFNGELGKIGGVRFLESTEAKVFLPEMIGDTGVRRMIVKTKTASATNSVVVEGEIPTGTNLSVPVVINGVKNTILSIETGSGQSVINLKDNVTVNAGDVISGAAEGDGNAAGGSGHAIFSTLVCGADAAATTEIEGLGLEHIVKPLGYGDDPLNQRSSCGWKATKVSKILNEDYIVRIESVNRYSLTISDN